jgi:hypothetical protein
MIEALPSGQLVPERGMRPHVVEKVGLGCRCQVAANINQTRRKKGVGFPGGCRICLIQPGPTARNAIRLNLPRTLNTISFSCCGKAPITFSNPRVKFSYQRNCASHVVTLAGDSGSATRMEFGQPRVMRCHLTDSRRAVAGDGI